MHNSFVDGFCLKLENLLNPEEIRQVSNLLNVYTMGYDIKPLSTDLTVSEYRLPEAYYVFMAAKEQDGRMSEKSKEQYRLCLEKLLYRFGLPLGNITINHLRLYIQEISVNSRTGKKLSKTTINQRKSIIRSFFKWLYEEEYIEKNPAIRIKPDKGDSKPRKEFTDVEIEAMRSSCGNLRERAIIDLLNSSGIRVSEMCGLNRKDIDLDKREITVYGKGGKWRTSYIDASAVVSLKRYFDSRTDDDPAAFVSDRNPHKRLSTSGVRKTLHSVSEKSGVENIIPHRFRHTMATKGINSGMPIESVQSILGHSMIETTLHYAHISHEKVKDDHRRYIQ